MTTIQVNDREDTCLHLECISQNGFTVCKQCGAVVSQDYSPHGGLSRSGEVMKSPSRPVAESALTRLRHLDRRERALIDHIQHLQRICSRLEIPLQTTDRACAIFTELHRAGLPKSLLQYCVALMVAAICRAAAEHRIPRSQRQVIEVLDSQEKVSGRMLMKARYLIIERYGPMQTDPTSLVVTYTSHLNIEGTPRAELISETIRLLKVGNSSGRSPSVIVAAAIWAAGVKLNLGIKQEELQTISRRCTMSIRNTAHTLWGIRAKEVSK